MSDWLLSADDNCQSGMHHILTPSQQSAHDATPVCPEWATEQAAWPPCKLLAALVLSLTEECGARHIVELARSVCPFHARCCPGQTVACHDFKRVLAQSAAVP